MLDLYIKGNYFEPSDVIFMPLSVILAVAPSVSSSKKLTTFTAFGFAISDRVELALPKRTLTPFSQVSILLK